MPKPFFVTLVVSLLCQAAAIAQADGDLPPLPTVDGNKPSSELPLFYEVPSTSSPSPQRITDEQRKIEQAEQNQREYLEDVRQKNVLPPLDTGYGGSPAFVPYNPIYSPFLRRYPYAPGYPLFVPNTTYSYSGTVSNFGAPMFVGQEMPNPTMFYQPTLPVIGGYAALIPFFGGGYLRRDRYVMPYGITPNSSFNYSYSRSGSFNRIGF